MITIPTALTAELSKYERRVLVAFRTIEARGQRENLTRMERTAAQ